MISQRFLIEPPQPRQPPDTLTLHRPRKAAVSARMPRAQQAENKARVSSAAKKIEQERITPDQRRKQEFLACKRAAMIVANEARRLVNNNDSSMREKKGTRRRADRDGIIGTGGAGRCCTGDTHPAQVPPLPRSVAVRAAGSAADTATFSSLHSSVTLPMTSRGNGPMTAPPVSGGGGYGYSGSGGSLSAALVAAGAIESPASSPHLGARSSTMHPVVKEAMTSSNNIDASIAAASAGLPASDEARVLAKPRKRRVSLTYKKVQDQKDFTNRLMHGGLRFPRPSRPSCPPSRIPPPMPQHQQSVVTRTSAAPRRPTSRSTSTLSKDRAPPSGMSTASTFVRTTSESEVSAVPAFDGELKDEEAKVAEMSNEELIRELALEMVERQRLDERMKFMTGGLGIETGGIDTFPKRLSDDCSARQAGFPRTAPSALSSEVGETILPDLFDPGVSEDSGVCGRGLQPGSPTPFSLVPGFRDEEVLSHGNRSADDLADQTSSAAIVAGAGSSVSSASVAEITSVLRDAASGPRGARTATVVAAESSAQLNMRASTSSAGWSDYDRRRQDVTSKQRDVTAEVDVAVDNRANEIILEVARARCAKQRALRREVNLMRRRNAVELAPAAVVATAGQSASAEGVKRFADVKAEAAPSCRGVECNKKRPQPARPPCSGRERRRRQQAPPAREEKTARTFGTPVDRRSRGVPSHVATSRAQAWTARKPLQQPPWRP